MVAPLLGEVVEFLPRETGPGAHSVRWATVETPSDHWRWSQKWSSGVYLGVHRKGSDKLIGTPGVFLAQSARWRPVEGRYDLELMKSVRAPGAADRTDPPRGGSPGLYNCPDQEPGQVPAASGVR